MKYMLFVKAILFILLFCLASVAYGQQLEVTRLDEVKKFDGGEMKAKVIFYSAYPDLMIDENNGERMIGPEKNQEGVYVYSFICDVTDTNKFVFNISAPGIVSKYKHDIYIEEGELRENNVKINSISVKKSDALRYTTEENLAIVTVTSNYQNLRIESSTGETAEGPELNSTNTFDYIIRYDLSSPESRKISRKLIFSAEKGESVEQDLGPLSAKQAIDLSVLVLSNSCYAGVIAHAKQCFLNGAYRDAYETYKKILQENECPDKPRDTTEDEEEMKRMLRLSNAYILASRSYDKAEKFHADNMLDSAMHYQQEAYRHRNYILKQNSSDPYCLEYNRKYHRFVETVPRIVSGQTVNSVRMNTQGKNLPLAGVRIIQTAHKREERKVNGIPVPSAGRMIKTIDPVDRGMSDGNGEFSVFVDRNTPDIIYVLNFTAEKEVFTEKSYSFKYIPKDVDKEMNAVIKITPKNVNNYNE